MELAETANELRMRNRDEALCVESALGEEGRGDRNLKARSTDAGGMGHERGERAIFVAGRDAQHQGRSHLGGEPQSQRATLHPAPGQPHSALATIQFEEDILSCVKQFVITGAIVRCQRPGRRQVHLVVRRRKRYRPFDHSHKVIITSAEGDRNCTVRSRALAFTATALRRAGSPV